MFKKVKVIVEIRLDAVPAISFSDIESELNAALDDVLLDINSDIISLGDDGAEVIEIRNYPESDAETPVLTFPNSFEDWQETHFEISYALIRLLDEEGSMANTIYKDRGHGGLIELAKDLTDKFEEKYKGCQWEGDFFDTLDLFIIDEGKEFLSAYTPPDDEPF